eukprot:67480_1
MMCCIIPSIPHTKIIQSKPHTKRMSLNNGSNITHKNAIEPHVLYGYEATVLCDGCDGCYVCQSDAKTRIFNAPMMYPYDVSISYNTNYDAHATCSTLVSDGPESNDDAAARPHCCESPDYSIRCIKRFGAPGSPLSGIDCPNDYFMSSCFGWSTPWIL